MPYIVNGKPFDDYGKYVGEMMRLRVKCYKVDDYTELFEFSPPIRKYEIPKMDSETWGYWFNGLRLYRNIVEKNDQLTMNLKEFCDRQLKVMEGLIQRKLT